MNTERAILKEYKSRIEGMEKEIAAIRSKQKEMESKVGTAQAASKSLGGELASKVSFLSLQSLFEIAHHLDVFTGNS